MELLQLNMWQGRMAPQILELVDERKPDFITAQEIYKGGDTVLAPELMFSIYDKISERFAYHAFAAVNALNIARGKAEMGTAIFSQFPIIKASSFFTHGTYMDGISVGNDVHNSRTLQTATIDVHGAPLHLLTHHGHWVPNKYGDDMSREKMQLVADHIQTYDQNTPLIFAGDLNVVAESPAMRPFDGLLIDQVANYEIKNTLSAIRHIGDIACDHILTNDLVRVKRTQALDQIVSDHTPVVLEFDI